MPTPANRATALGTVDDGPGASKISSVAFLGMVWVELTAFNLQSCALPEYDLQELQRAEHESTSVKMTMEAG